MFVPKIAVETLKRERIMQITVENRAAADFASLAANPAVQVLADDFDGDGNTDLALVNQGGGWTSVPIALSTATGFTVENISTPDFANLAANPNVEAVSADFNGDGKADIGLVNHGAGWTTVPIALSSTTGFTVENLSSPDFAGWAASPDVQVLADDFNGDGKTDLALVNQAPGWTTVPIALSDTAGFTVANLSAPDFAGWAASPDVEAVPGDFDGNGSADIALINHALGWNTIPIAFVSSAGVTVQNRPAADFAALAASPDVTVIADDFSGDGRADLALVNQAGGWTSVPIALSELASFSINNVSAANFASLAANTSVSVLSGDFNNDGLADFGLINQAPGWTTVPIGFTTV